MPGTEAGNSVLLFDGLCVLCDGFALFVAKRDRKKAFRLEPLQGEVAKDLIPDDAKAVADGSAGSIVLWLAGTTYRKSEALLRVLQAFGGAWKVLAIFLRLVPRIVRDAAYDVVARNRTRWFGRRESCRMPGYPDS